MALPDCLRQKGILSLQRFLFTIALRPLCLHKTKLGYPALSSDSQGNGRIQKSITTVQVRNRQMTGSSMILVIPLVSLRHKQEMKKLVVPPLHLFYNNDNVGVKTFFTKNLF